MIDSSPQFVVFVGSMMSGKTSMLLMTLEKYRYQKKRIVAFKPAIDDRYSRDSIVSHGGWSIPAVQVETGNDILKHLSEQTMEPHVVAVDEAFMVPNVASVLTWLFKSGVNVVVSTLDLSASCKPFHEVKEMLPWATKVVKCSAACSVCGSDARYSYSAMVTDEISVGGSEKFEPRCFNCHPHVNNKP